MNQLRYIPKDGHVTIGEWLSMWEGDATQLPGDTFATVIATAATKNKP